MNTIIYNKYKYQFLNDFAKDLERTAKDAESSAEHAYQNCIEEETGAVNPEIWYYQEYLEYKDRAEAAKKLIKELEKI